MRIEKNMPISPKGKNGSAEGIYAVFMNMEVGDSILADGEAASSQRCPAYNCALQYSRKYGVKFTGRKQSGNKVRIWRVA